MRGISTTPIILAILIIAVTSGILAYQWFYAQQKAVEMQSKLAAIMAADQNNCLNALTNGSGVIIDGTYYKNYTGIGCYADSNIVIIVQEK